MSEIWTRDERPVSRFRTRKIRGLIANIGIQAFFGKRCLKTRMPERLDLKRVYEGCIETLSHVCCIEESELLWLLLPLSFSLSLPARIATRFFHL